MNDLDRGAVAALNLLRRAMTATDDETTWQEHAEGIEFAIKEGGVGLAIRREMDFEKTLNVPGEFNVREVYGRFPQSLARLATPGGPV